MNIPLPQMTAFEFLSHLNDLDIKLSLDGDRLRCNAPKGRLTPALRTELVARKAEMVAYLQNGHSGEGAAPLIQRISRDGELPLSFAQQRLWFLNELEGASATYNMPGGVRLSGKLNLAALNATMTEIVRRHDVLRTTFPLVNGEVRQTITPPSAISLPVVDLQPLPKEEQDAEVERLASEEAKRPFDLAKGPLLRLTLLRLAQEEHVLLVTMHHIVSDGWSVGIFIEEMSILYTAMVEKEPVTLAGILPELPIQYADFAAWQRKWLQGDVLERQLSFWRQQLADAPPLLELPTDRPRPPVQTFRGSREYFEIDADLTEKLKALTIESGGTLFMTLLAAFGTLLARYSGQSNIVIGSPIANRHHHEIESLIGFFVNTLALHIDLSENPTVSELFDQVRQRALGAYAHQDLPFEKLVEELQPERNLSHAPIFQVMFVLQNVPGEDLTLPGLTLSSLESDTVTSKFDMNLSIGEEEGELLGSWEYNSDLFDQRTIQQMIKHLKTLLAGMVANSQQRVNELRLLTEEEEHQLLVEWNETERAIPSNGVYSELFEAQVRQTPDAVAAIFENDSLTYRQLNARANQWANLLIKQGVGPDTIVGLLAYRGLDFLTAVLAIFKAGGAYLPLDPFHPAKRIYQVLEQSQSPLVLAAAEFDSVLSEAIGPPLTPPNTRGGTVDSPSGGTVDSPSLSIGRAGRGVRARVLFLEQIKEQAVSESDKNRPARSTADDLAYVIFTSGSTGVPKGAMVEQKGMINHLYAKIWDLKLTKRDTVGQNASQCFDISVWQFLSGLLVGGRVYIFNEEAARDPVQLLQKVADHQVTILEVVPSLMRMMLEVAPTVRPNLADLRWLVPTGEALPPSLCRQWFKHYPTIPMINAYGPTECSDDVTHYPIYKPPAADVINMPIGRPVANMRMYILDAELQPVPIGVAGELYVGGVGVGRGYLNNAERTAEAFMNDPFSSEANARLYKTGDKARYILSGEKDLGNIEFLGRLDFQVKIRGFRIELGEIEAALSEHPDVRETVVIAREEPSGDKRLVAYWVPALTPQPPLPILGEGELSVPPLVLGGVRGGLRRYLFDLLPDYMVPAAFVMLESMPLTANGKINRRVLPAPDISQTLTAEEFVAPSSATQKTLAPIWADLLGIDASQLGINNNFFELGGHSLLATQVISRVRNTFQVELPLRTLFERATIADFSQAIEEAKASGAQIEPQPIIGRASRRRYRVKASALG